MLLDKIFFIALGFLALMVLMIMLKIFIDIKRSAKTRTQRFELKLSEFNERRRQIIEDEQQRCSNCLLNKWFTVDVDGEVIIKVPGKIEVHNETLFFKGKVPQ